MSGELAEHPLGETVARGPLTGRNLSDFALCPHKYLLSFFSSGSKSVERIGGPAALHRAVRAAVLAAYRASADFPASFDVARRAFDLNWDGSPCKDSREEEDLRRDGLLMLERLRQEPLPLGGLVRADLHLEGELAGSRFAAVADLVSADPPRVLRLVTSRRPPSAAELPDDPSWALLYLLGRRHLSDAATEAVMADLRRGRGVSFSLERERIESAEAALARQADRIQRERAFRPVKGPHCRWCRSQRECPAWPR
jgi:hypothetical protein